MPLILNTDRASSTSCTIWFYFIVADDKVRTPHWTFCCYLIIEWKVLKEVRSSVYIGPRTDTPSQLVFAKMEQFHTRGYGSPGSFGRAPIHRNNRASKANMMRHSGSNQRQRTVGCCHFGTPRPRLSMRQKRSPWGHRGLGTAAIRLRRQICCFRLSANLLVSSFAIALVASSRGSRNQHITRGHGSAMD